MFNSHEEHFIWQIQRFSANRVFNHYVTTLETT